MRLTNIEEAFADLIWHQVGVRLLGQLRLRRRFKSLFPFPQGDLIKASIEWWRKIEGEREEYPRISGLISAHLNSPSDLICFQLPVVDPENQELYYWWTKPERLLEDVTSLRTNLNFPFNDERCIFGIQSRRFGSVKGFKDCRLSLRQDKIGLVWCATTDTSLYIPDLREHQSKGESSEPETDVLWGVGSVIYLPQIYDSKVNGVLVLYSPVHGLFGPEVLVSRATSTLPYITTFKVNKTFFRNLHDVIVSIVDLPRLVFGLQTIKGYYQKSEERLKYVLQMAASHEDKTHLSIALDNIQQDLQGIAKNIKNTKASNACQSAARALSELKIEVDERIDFILNPTGQAKTDVNQGLEYIKTRFRPWSDKIQYAVAEELQQLPIHPWAFKHILKELIANALDARDKNDTSFHVIVQISGSPVKEAEIAVIDTGKGIDPDLLPERLFERDVTTKPPGTQHFGVGLTVVREIVAQYRGTIQAKNRKERGAEFIIRLPLP